MYAIVATNKDTAVTKYVQSGSVIGDLVLSSNLDTYSVVNHNMVGAEKVAKWYNLDKKSEWRITIIKLPC